MTTATPREVGHVPTAAVSAALKRKLSETFPGVPFRVRKGTGTATAWLSVSWADGPAPSKVEKITRPFQGEYWDSSDECYHATGNTVTVTWKGETITGRPLVEGIHTHQNPSAEATAEASRLWSQAHGGADPKATGYSPTVQVGGVLIGDDYACMQVNQIVREVVIPRRWAAVRDASTQLATATAPVAAPAPAGEGLTLTHSAADGIIMRGTQRGDGAGDALKAAGFRWYRKGAFWYVPRTRNAESAPRLAVVAEQLRAAGLTVATPGVPGLSAPEPQG